MQCPSHRPQKPRQTLSFQASPRLRASDPLAKVHLLDPSVLDLPRDWLVGNLERCMMEGVCNGFGGDDKMGGAETVPGMSKPCTEYVVELLHGPTLLKW
jgi:hypothetical protein